MTEQLEPLVDAGKIATHLGCSKRHFLERVKFQPDFPKPVTVKPHKWRVVDINNWMERKAA